MYRVCVCVWGQRGAAPSPTHTRNTKTVLGLSYVNISMKSPLAMRALWAKVLLLPHLSHTCVILKTALADFCLFVCFIEIIIPARLKRQ